MLQRYYFDLTDGRDVIEDAVGVEAASLDEALAEARKVLAEYGASGELSGLTKPWWILVRDGERRIVQTLFLATRESQG